MNLVLRSALAGAATGGRTFTGLAALAAATPPTANTQPDRALRRASVRVPIGLLAVTELVTDKLLRTPSRLGPPGLIGRGLAAALCGVVIACRHLSRPRAPNAGVGTTMFGEATVGRTVTAACVAAAIASAGSCAWLGVQWRARNQHTAARAWFGAVAEDVTVIALAATSALDAVSNGAKSGKGE